LKDEPELVEKKEAPKAEKAESATKEEK